MSGEGIYDEVLVEAYKLIKRFEEMEVEREAERQTLRVEMESEEEMVRRLKLMNTKVEDLGGKESSRLGAEENDIHKVF